MRLQHDLVEFLRAWCVIWRLQWGVRRQWKSAERWMTQRDCEVLIFNQIPASIVFDVVDPTAFFVLWSMQHRCTCLTATPDWLRVIYFTPYPATRIPAIRHETDRPWERRQCILFGCLVDFGYTVPFGRNQAWGGAKSDDRWRFSQLKKGKDPPAVEFLRSLYSPKNERYVYVKKAQRNRILSLFFNSIYTWKVDRIARTLLRTTYVPRDLVQDHFCYDV